MNDIPSALFLLHTLCIAVLLGFAAWRDVATRTIPDTVSILLILVGAGTRLCQGWEPFGVSLLVAVAIFVGLIPFCSRGILGGADLKLLAALATGLPPQASLTLIAYVTLVGGILALLYLLAKRLLLIVGADVSPKGRADSLLSRIVSIEFWRIQRNSPLPYGIAIAIGAGIAVLNQPGA